MQMARAMVAVSPGKGEKPEREAIHSGHFMVSHFEAEEQDDEDELAVPIPEEPPEVKPEPEKVVDSPSMGMLVRPQLGIDTTFSKLFQCMSLAYRQKLTSPKWNRFRGIRLRWKDKIRLNNVIWRCWHMQFIKKENTLICQFASPLDVDTHNKPEAVVLEGKYWKRKLAAVTAEYKKWRMFYRNQQFGHNKDSMDMLAEMDLMSWHNMSNNEDNLHMMVDEDYMGLMSDTLFSTITNQPFVFPDTREIARAGLADFIQPSLGPLQPNLDDYMDTLEPFHDLISEKLPTVPEEQTGIAGYKDGWYVDLGLMHPNANMQLMQPQNNVLNTYQMEVPVEKTSLTDTRIQQYDPSIVYGNNQLYTQTAMISKEPPKVDPNNYGYIVNSNQKIDATQSNMNYAMNQPINQGYKFATPVTPNIKFTSQQLTLTNNVKTIGTISDDKLTAKTKPASTRGRPRSRSNTREPLKKPPLISAISDPSLVNSSNSALLTQLLTSKSTLRDHAASTTMENASFMTRKLDDVKRLDPVPIRPKTEQVFITPVNIISLSNDQKDPLMLNSMSSSNSPILDSQCLNSPTSSQGSIGSPTRDSPRDHRRAGHIHAEQKRRYNIKNGFDMIHSLIPQLNQNPNAKLSKAAMLQKGADYIKQLRSERNLLKDEMDNLRQQIETLNTSISNCQSLLPATGAPVSRRRDNKMQEMFDDYVRERTLKDWKFWIFSLLFRPLLTSFNNFVSTSSIEDLYHSTLLWVEQHCTLVELRPVVLNSLRYLCTKTEILSEPDRLPDEARQIVLSGSSSQGPNGQM